MPNSRLHKPSLYRPVGTDALPDYPALLATRCECGYTHFPPQHYGCEQCGKYGDALTDVALSGQGTVTAVATVHLHQAAGGADDVRPLAAPFTIATVELDEGPRVRGVLADKSATADVGARVFTSLVDIGRDGSQVLDLRFVLAG